jgi:hypothetical protein
MKCIPVLKEKSLNGFLPSKEFSSAFPGKLFISLGTGKDYCAVRLRAFLPFLPFPTPNTVKFEKMLLIADSSRSTIVFVVRGIFLV